MFIAAGIQQSAVCQRRPDPAKNEVRYGQTVATNQTKPVFTYPRRDGSDTDYAVDSGRRGGPGDRERRINGNVGAANSRGIALASAAPRRFPALYAAGGGTRMRRGQNPGPFSGGLMRIRAQALMPISDRSESARPRWAGALYACRGGCDTINAKTSQGKFQIRPADAGAFAPRRVRGDSGG